MKYLSENYWSNFKKDGKLFEQLSKVLIEYEYKQKDFYIVGGPGDGGKDICLDIPMLGNYSSQIWAQCKYHHSTLSFDDISFTLLMAYLKNTNQILIFSYSKVSDCFAEYLNEYRTRTGKNVILYADEVLENLIFKHRKKLLSEHKEFFASFPESKDDLTLAFDTDYQLYINGTRIRNNETTITLNTICELVITVTNQTLSEQKIKLECIRNRISNHFTFISDSKQSCRIGSNESIVIKMFIKLKDNITKTALPSFKITCNEQVIKVSSPKKVNCRWLADTSLIGNKYYTALDRINVGIKYSHFHLVYVYGKSGVGKTRILKEAQEQSIRSNKRIIHVDSEKKHFSCKQFIDILCSKITLLPIFNRKITVLTNTYEETLEYAAKILYDENFDVHKEWENISKFLSFLLERERIVLVLDNFQHFDTLSIQIIEKCILISKNSKSESTIILGINTDYIYKNSVFDEFFYQLKCFKNTSPDYYTDIPIDGFEPCDTKLYIKECLTYVEDDNETTNINYERAINRIAKYCGNNPFYIQQFLLFLYQKGILKRSRNTLFYFADAVAFAKSFSQIPQNVETLILEREKHFLKYETERNIAKYRNLIYLLNITKCLPIDIYYDVIGDTDLLTSLIDLGFLSLEDDGITPIHSYFCRYYKSKYRIESASNNLLKKLIISIEKHNAISDLGLSYFWAKFQIDEVLPSDLKCTISKVTSYDVDYSFYAFSIKAICKSLERGRDDFNDLEYCKIYEIICKKIDETLGINESIYYYENLVNAFLKNPIRYVDCINVIEAIITEYLIHLVNLEEYKKCMDTLINVRNSISTITEEDGYKLLYQTNRCEIMIHNRNNMVSEANVLSNENIDILQNKISDEKFRNKFIYSAKRSIGNTYFYSTSAYDDRKKIIDSWDVSFNLYVENNGNDIEEGYSLQPKIAAYAKGLAADMIANREDAAETKAKFFINAFNNMHMMYYEMQIRLLIAMHLAWKWSDSIYFYEHIAEINNYIDQTLDIAAIYGRKLTTINAFHLRASVYYIAKNHKLALDNYNITAELLINYLKTEKDYCRWEYFWIDYARALRNCNCNIKDDIISNIIRYCSNSTVDLIKNICDMDDDAFRSYNEEYEPQTAITDKHHIINFPKI